MDSISAACYVKVFMVSGQALSFGPLTRVQADNLMGGIRIKQGGALPYHTVPYPTEEGKHIMLNGNYVVSMELFEV